MLTGNVCFSVLFIEMTPGRKLERDQYSSLNDENVNNYEYTLFLSYTTASGIKFSLSSTTSWKRRPTSLTISVLAHSPWKYQLRLDMSFCVGPVHANRVDQCNRNLIWGLIVSVILRNFFLMTILATIMGFFLLPFLVFTEPHMTFVSNAVLTVNTYLKHKDMVYLWNL